MLTWLLGMSTISEITSQTSLLALLSTGGELSRNCNWFSSHSIPVFLQLGFTCTCNEILVGERTRIRELRVDSFIGFALFDIEEKKCTHKWTNDLFIKNLCFSFYYLQMVKKTKQTRIEQKVRGKIAKAAAYAHFFSIFVIT